MVGVLEECFGIVEEPQTSEMRLTLLHSLKVLACEWPMYQKRVAIFVSLMFPWVASAQAQLEPPSQVEILCLGHFSSLNSPSTAQRIQ